MRFMRTSLTLTGAGGSYSGWPNPMTLQIPCVAGATIAAMMNGGGGTAVSTISSITDSNGNPWSQIAVYSYGNNYAQAYYAPNVTCSSNIETLTVTSIANTGDNTIVFYVILGASTDPLDTYSGGGQNRNN
jgi:hypothetical protein